MSRRKNLFLITTSDNPYSPFDDYTTWYYEDIRLGHNTCGLLARMSAPSDLFNDDADFLAMRSIVELNLSGKHLIVTKDDYDPYLKKELSSSVS